MSTTRADWAVVDVDTCSAVVDGPAPHGHVTDRQGAILIEHTLAAPGIGCAGNGRTRSRRPQTLEPSPVS
jgi:hypothetical protein